MKGIFTFLSILCLCISLNAQITQTRTAATVTPITGNQEVAFSLVTAPSFSAALAATDAATANVTLKTTTGAQRSQVLVLSGFNFLIPPTDVDITNITIAISGKASAANAIRVENLSLIAQASTPTVTLGTIQNQGTFPTTQGNITLGGALSSFGSPTLTPAILNNPNFGITLQIQNFTGGGPSGINNVQALIDQITVSVTFQPSAITPLPVEFISLEASKAVKGVQVAWKVGTEVNVNHYEVERSTDGNNFKKIGTVAASQNYSYSYTDMQPTNGVAYYRVRNVDQDGAFKYSTVVKYNNGLSTTLFKAFPTTTNAQVTFQHPSVSGKAIITINSLEGKSLRSIAPSQGSYSTIVDLSAYPSGMYLLRYQGENGYSETFRIVKQ